MVLKDGLKINRTSHVLCFCLLYFVLRATILRGRPQPFLKAANATEFIGNNRSITRKAIAKWGASWRRQCSHLSSPHALFIRKEIYHPHSLNVPVMWRCQRCMLDSFVEQKTPFVQQQTKCMRTSVPNIAQAHDIFRSRNSWRLACRQRNIQHTLTKPLTFVIPRTNTHGFSLIYPQSTHTQYAGRSEKKIPPIQ